MITGVLECIDRDDAQSLIERGGGRVTKSVSKKTTYIVVGRDPGNTKINKAATLGTKQITEDKFFELVDRGFAPSKKKGEGAYSPSVFMTSLSLGFIICSASRFSRPVVI